MRTFAVGLCLLVAASTASAQIAYVPDAMPSVGGSGNEPMNFPSTTGRYQQVLDAQYLPNQPVRFNAVAFAQAGLSPTQFQVSGDFQLRLAHTTLSCPTANLNNNMPPVPTDLAKVTNGYTYNAPQLSGWADFTTTQDFGYDGMSNLILEVRFRGQNTGLGFVCRTDSRIGRAWASSTSTDNFNASTGSMSCSNGLKTRLVYVSTDVLLAPNTVQVGNTLGIGLSGLKSGDTFQIAASFTNTPLRLTASRTIHLGFDNLFRASVTVGPPIFNNYVNVVPAAGRTGASLRVPNFPALAGVAIYHAAVTVGNGMISGATNTAGTMIIP